MTHYSDVQCAAASHHCGVAAADELADFVKDALAVDGLIQGAALHDDGHGQEDLLPNVLLQAGEERGRE